MLTALELQQVRNVLTLRVTTGFLQLVTLRTVHATQVREEQNPAVRSGHKEVLHHVITAQRGTLNALTATVLATVLITAGALNVAAASNRHHDLFLRDEVFHGHIAVVAVHNLGATLIAVAVHNLAQLLRDNLALASLRSNNRVVLSDHAHQLIVAILNLLTLQSSQTTQLHVQNCLSLSLINLQELHQAATRLISGGGAANQGNNLIQSIQSLQQATQDVRLFLRLTQTVTGTTNDNVHLVIHPVTHKRVQGQGTRHTINNGEHIRGEVLLQLGVLVQVVQHNLRGSITLEHNHQTLTGTTRSLIAKIRDTGDLTVLDELSNLNRQVIRVRLIRQLSDHQAGTTVDFLHIDHRAHGDRATASTVRILNALGAQNLCTGREVRALNARHQSIQQLLIGGVRVLQEPLHTLGNLTQVMRRNIGRHTHSNTRRTVDQQVRDARGQNGRLQGLAVVVGLEINGVFVDVTHHLKGNGSHLGLGVSRRCSTVVTGGAEVTLTQSQRVTHNPALNQTHQSVVDSAIAVGVELTHHVADHAGALIEGSVRAVAAVVHRVDHAAVHGLEAVTHIRQGAANNNRHCVVQVGTLHFGLQVHLFNVTVVVYIFSATVANYINLSGFILLFFAHYFLIPQ